MTRSGEKRIYGSIDNRMETCTAHHVRVGSASFSIVLESFDSSHLDDRCLEASEATRRYGSEHIPNTNTKISTAS
jgi:hypothetical protein